MQYTLDTGGEKDVSSTKYIRELSEQNAVYKRMISSVRCGSESGSHSDNEP